MCKHQVYYFPPEKSKHTQKNNKNKTFNRQLTPSSFYDGVRRV
jgi:hypothetical protein